MRNRYAFNCQYCGHDWVEEVYYVPRDMSHHKCRICKEAKLITVKDASSKDVYGYQFSPDFPEKSKTYMTEEVASYYDDFGTTD